MYRFSILLLRKKKTIAKTSPVVSPINTTGTKTPMDTGVVVLRVLVTTVGVASVGMTSSVKLVGSGLTAVVGGSGTQLVPFHTSKPVQSHENVPSKLTHLEPSWSEQLCWWSGSAVLHSSISVECKT